MDNKNQFSNISESLFNNLNNGEELNVSTSGENTQFIRFNNAKIRQTGLVLDGNLSINLIYNNRSCEKSFTLCNNESKNIEKAKLVLDELRKEIVQLPEDPFIIMPQNLGSSDNVYKGDLLLFDQAADILIASMGEIDLSGIWASGSLYRGNVNSKGQKHWFSTESYSLDYSLITKDEKMVKATYAGNKWNNNDYHKFMQDSKNKLKIMERESITIKPGEYRTYIASAGVSDLIDMLSWNGISESSIQQGHSALGKMRNEKLKLSPCFSLFEDFRSGSVPKFNSDGEIASDLMPLIDKGILANTLISSRTAKEYNLTSNQASNFEGIRSPNMSGGELNEKDVLQSIGTGIYLGNLHYLNWSDNIGGRVTGMTRYACFWVENGEIVAPINTMRFDDSLYNFFGRNLESVSKDVLFNPDTGTYNNRSLGGTYCPGILLSAFSLTL